MDTAGTGRAPLWFDGTKHPALDLKLVVIPAYIIPVTLALLYPTFERLHRRAQDARSNAEFEAVAHEADAKDVKPANSPLDLEKTGNSTSEAEESERLISKSLTRRTAFQVYHQQWTYHLLVTLGQPEADFEGKWILLCTTQPAVVMLSWYLYNLDVRACLLIAVGWVIFYFQNPPSGLVATLFALLAVPYIFCEAKDEGEGVNTQSGGCLLILMCNFFISRNSWIRYPRIWFIELWPWATFALLWILRTMFGPRRPSSELGPEIQEDAGTDFVEQPVEESPTEDTQQLASGSDVPNGGITIFMRRGIIATWKELRFWGEILFFLMATVCFPILFFWFLSAYSFTCLGWMWIIYDCAVEPPTIVGIGGVPGGVVYVLAQYRAFMRMPKPTPGPKARFYILEYMTSGATTTALTSVWWVLLWIVGMVLKNVWNGVYSASEYSASSFEGFNC